MPLRHKQLWKKGNLFLENLFSVKLVREKFVKGFRTDERSDKHLPRPRPRDRSRAARLRRSCILSRRVQQFANKRRPRVQSYV